MARSKDVLLGHLRGVGAGGGPAIVNVYKAGRDYRISHLDKTHQCHPSVRSIAKVKAEAFLVLHVGKASFEPL